MATAKVDAKEQTTLERVDDGAFHKREIVVQRIGRVLLAFFVLAGLLGAFGAGPLSHATARNAGNFELRFHRAARFASPTELRLQGSSPSMSDATIRVSLNADFVAAVEIEDIVPQPTRVAGNESLLVMDVEVEQGAPLEVRILYQPRAIGLLSGAVGIEGRGEVRFRQFVFP